MATKLSRVMGFFATESYRKNLRMKFFTNLGARPSGTTRKQSDLDFGFGYSPPGERRWTSTVPKNQEVWAYALEKTYTKLKGHRRLTALMGIVYRWNEPETIEAFDTLLSEHLLSFQMSESPPENFNEFSPWRVVRAMGELELKAQRPRRTIHYVKFGEKWSIRGLGCSPINLKKPSDGDYYSLSSPPNGAEIYGAASSLECLKFILKDTKRRQDNTLSKICRVATIFASEVLRESDASEFLEKLDASKPSSFVHKTKSAEIAFKRFEFSDVREAEEFVTFSLIIEKSGDSSRSADSLT